MKVSEMILATQKLWQWAEDELFPRVGPKMRANLNELATLPLDAEYTRGTAPGEIPTAPTGALEISQEAVDLILESEGVDQPSKWPGGGSGVTLGYGCDIGADPQSLQFWREELTPEQMQRLATAKGITGRQAQVIAPRFRDIKVSKEQSLRVFHRFTLPVEIAKTKAAFPGAELLPPAALGALVSVVFNRGTSRKGSRRVDMQDIYDILHDGVQSGDLEKLAQQFRDMKKLWRGMGLDGLITRREREAKLIESAIV